MPAFWLHRLQKAGVGWELPGRVVAAGWSEENAALRPSAQAQFCSLQMHVSQGLTWCSGWVSTWKILEPIIRAYLSGTFSLCQDGANSHFSRLLSTFSPMHQNVVTLGGGCVCFSKSVRKGHFRNVWVGGGVGGHSFAHRAVRGRTHRAQAMVQGSLIISNPIRCHRCPFLQGPGLHWGTHPRACDWEHISSVFPNPAACVASLVPTLCSGAWPTGHL